MRVFVINLDRCPERMTRLAGLLGALGVPFERIAAVDGRELDPIPPAKAFNGRYVMTRSELACVLSHRMAWFRFIASADEYCLVLEDDVHLGKDFGAIARGDIGLEAAAFDLIKIETRSHKIWVDRFDARTVGGQRRIARLHSAHLGAAAYIISRAGVEKVLPATESDDPRARHSGRASPGQAQFRGAVEHDHARQIGAPEANRHGQASA
jgi:glycosyl transferase family 25